jgi:hypothetical protein
MYREGYCKDEDGGFKNIWPDKLSDELKQTEILATAKIKGCRKRISKTDKLSEAIDRLDNKIDILLSAINELLERRD